MALNACELEIDLFCHGLRVPGDVLLDGARPISRTRAGLGSGLEMVIPTGSHLKREVWVNVPVAERFAQSSPYRLAGSPEAGHVVIDDRSAESYAVRLPPEPVWYAWQTSNDLEMRRVGVLQGTYLAVYVNPVCAFWSADPPLNCHFCTTGQNVGSSADAAAK